MQQTFEVSGPVELELRLAAGDIQIDPTLERRVEIELTAHDEKPEPMGKEQPLGLMGG